MRDRILEFLRKENKSSVQFAKEIGVQPSGISHILSGRNKPSLDFVIKVLSKYKYLSSDWLLFGKGEMYTDATEPTLFDSEKNISGEMQDLKDEQFLKKEEIDFGTDTISGQQPILPAGMKNIRKTAKIVIFYDDGTFTEYFPASGNDK